MTDAEKKMKNYTNAVERKLNLPRDVKRRVMSDFVSSIAARREAGQTADEIYADLGTPEMAAADLNEQMKEFACRKSPWRYLFAAAAAYGAAELLGELAVWAAYLFAGDPFRVLGTDASIGIIGGADGPTAIFVTGPSWTSYILPCLLIIVGIWGYFRLCRCKRSTN